MHLTRAEGLIGVQKREDLRNEAKELAPAIAHQQEAQQWRSGWLEVVSHCKNHEFLQFTMAEIQRQKRQFADLPDVVESVEKIWCDRWEELKKIKVS
jgi:hypothetical protein